MLQELRDRCARNVAGAQPDLIGEDVQIVPLITRQHDLQTCVVFDAHAA
jgi:hypothetical protein